MKKIFSISILILLIIACIQVDGTAQYGYKKKKKRKRKEKTERKEKVDFAQNLWYGGGMQINFGANQYYSQFVFGLSPMVGYKITNRFSAGPRVSVIFNSFRIQTTTGVEKITPISWSVGAFSRYQILSTIFAHVEYEYKNEAYLTYNLETQYEKRNNFYLGAGYASNSGSLIRYEIMLLYNFLVPENSIASPFDYRVALTYNF